jgi:hypothetical protein
MIENVKHVSGQSAPAGAAPTIFSGGFRVSLVAFSILLTAQVVAPCINCPRPALPFSLPFNRSLSY